MNKKLTSFNLEKKTESLPIGWVSTKLNTICEKIVDGTHFTPQYTSSGIPFISVKDIRNDKISFNDCKFISEETHNELKKRCNPENNDILITKSGTIGRIAVVKTNKKFSLFVSVALIKPYKNFIDSQFLAYELNNYINHIDIQQSIKGGVIKNFHLEDLKEVKIFLAPYNEQKRIVTKLEELFTKLYAGIEYLKKNQILLKQYRQSILKHAFEGNLTEKWRKENKENIEFSSTEKLGKKYELITSDSDSNQYNISNIPEGWVFVKLGEILNLSKDKYVPRKEENLNFIGLEHIESNTGKILGYGKSSNTKSMKNKFDDGDILYGKLRPYLNKVCVPNFSGVCSTDILVFKKTNYYNNKFIAMILLTNKFVQYSSQNMSGVQHPRVSYDVISEYVIPFPPLLEQNQIIELIAKSFSIVENQTYLIIRNIKVINKFHRSILQKTFEGTLVSQDPNDEPASILLEKIKKEQESAIPIKKENSKITKRKCIDNDSKQMRLM